MPELLNEKEFEEVWMYKLTEQQRKKRAEDSFRVMRSLGEKQLDLLQKATKNVNVDTLSFIYFHETVKSTWEHMDLALSLGKGKNKRFAFFPARTVMENTFRLEYFSRKTREEQEEIATKECLRIMKRHYDNELANNDPEAAEKFREFYDNFSQGKFPDIASIDERNLEPFPSMRKLTKDSKIPGSDAWYFHYQALAEQTHGKLLSVVIGRQDEAQEYRRSIMYLCVMMQDVLKNTDAYLGGKTRDEVVEAIRRAEQIAKRPLAENQREK